MMTQQQQQQEDDPLTAKVDTKAARVGKKKSTPTTPSGTVDKPTIPPLTDLESIQSNLAKYASKLSPELVSALKKLPPQDWFSSGVEAYKPIPGMNLGLFGRSILTHTLRCWTRGHWVFNPQASGRHYPWLEVLPWDGDEWHDGIVAMREELARWEWIPPEECAFGFKTELEDGEFCSALNGRGVLLVGDSLNNQFFRTFYYTLKRFHSGEGRMSIYNRQRVIDTDGPGFQLCDNWRPSMKFPKYPTMSLKVSWNYVLSYPGEKDGQTPEQKWNTGLGLHEIVILNRGAHYRPDDVLQRELNHTLHQVREASSKLHPHQLLIYRQTVRAHANCQGHRKPWTGEEESNWDVVNEMNPDWHWSDFFRQNRIAEPLLYPDAIRGINMDVRRMMGLRPDGRRTNQDCLHYLVPGPIDYWPLYIYNLLTISKHLQQWEEELLKLNEEFDLSLPKESIQPPWPVEGFGILPTTLSRNDSKPFIPA